jgi:hypothetical protein
MWKWETVLVRLGLRRIHAAVIAGTSSWSAVSLPEVPT